MKYKTLRLNKSVRNLFVLVLFALLGVKGYAQLPGALNGLFTINDDGDQVYFSQGNLQYIGSASTPYWKFADHQWDCLGTTTGQNSDSVTVDRDLFGWGTSGFDNGQECYQPWSTTAYYQGESYYSWGDLTGSADWGYNASYSRGKWNGGFSELEPGKGYIYVSAPNSADRVLIFQSGTKTNQMVDR